MQKDLSRALDTVNGHEIQADRLADAVAQAGSLIQDMARYGQGRTSKDALADSVSETVLRLLLLLKQEGISPNRIRRHILDVAQEKTYIPEPRQGAAEHILSDRDLAGKTVLDVTCGTRSIWFDKQDLRAVYCDRRKENLTGIYRSQPGYTLDVDPDVLCDFTDLPFDDNSFRLVVFDPPHLSHLGETSYMAKKYGLLPENWPSMLHDGFQECMRVLKPGGTLVFKWSEHDFPAKAIWNILGQTPLFGHKSPKQSGTLWACFVKPENRSAKDHPARFRPGRTRPGDPTI